jgi:hypothetical protein
LQAVEPTPDRHRLRNAETDAGANGQREQPVVGAGKIRADERSHDGQQEIRY